MRVLLISIHFPPILGASSRGMAELSKALVAHGHEVNVLTVVPVAGHPVYKFNFAEMRHVSPKINIHRVAMGPINRLTSRTLKAFAVSRQHPNDGVQNGGASHPPDAARHSTLAERLYNARKLIQPLLIPDANLDWIPLALLEARRMLSKDRYDVVASFGYPHSTHLVAYLALRGRDTSWVMMHAEGWGTSPGVRQLPKWSRRLHWALDRRLSHAASRIVVCGCAEGLLTRIPEAYGIDPSKLSLAQFAFAESAVPESTPKTQRVGLHIVFTGTFYPETGQDPRVLFEAIKTCGRADITLSISGQTEQLFENYVKAHNIPNVEFLGWCSRDQALLRQQNAKVLLVYGHGGGQQIPTKLYEYFAARRPILCLTIDDEDLTARLVLRHKRGIVVPNSREQILDALLTLASLDEEESLDRGFNLEELPEYSPALSGQQLMLAVLGEISDQERKRLSGQVYLGTRE
jgi:glycosyltransferase involved in cell wall biosynthesis